LSPNLDFAQRATFNTDAYVYRNDKLRLIYPIKYKIVPEITFFNKATLKKNKADVNDTKGIKQDIKPIGLAILEPKNFHRKIYKDYHDRHSSSIPAPSSLVKNTARKHLEAARHSLLYSKAGTEIAPGIGDLAKILQHTHIHTGADSVNELTHGLLAQELRHWHRDSEFISDAAYREQHNPFPNEEMNHGWNRARCEGQMFFSEQPKFSHTLSGGPEIRSKLNESLSMFSLCRQFEPIQLEENAINLFDFVFIGREEVGKSDCDVN
jgi:hypothetical protein